MSKVADKQASKIADKIFVYLTRAEADTRCASTTAQRFDATLAMTALVDARSHVFLSSSCACMHACMHAGVYLELGANDAVILSNTNVLDKKGWKGW